MFCFITLTSEDPKPTSKENIEIFKVGFGVCLRTHCSHLDIYISQKTGSVCSEFVRPISNEPRGQTYEFFYLKIQIYYTHFSSIFCRNCQIQCFLDTDNAISKRLKYLIHVFASNCNLNTSTLWNSSNSLQKALD